MLRTLIISLVILLSACSSTTQIQYGNFIGNATYEEIMAEDAAKKLRHAYSPANTRLNMNQNDNDPFGKKLVKLLRQERFAVSEFVDSDKKILAAKKTNGLKLNYIIDKPVDELYRITLFIGSESFSRAYKVENGIIKPASAWTHKE